MHHVRQNTNPALVIFFGLFYSPVMLISPLATDCSVDEVHTEEVQQQAPKHEVSKRALVRDALELGLVLRVGLDAEGGCEDELTDAGAESGQKSIERLIRGQNSCKVAYGLYWTMSRRSQDDLRSCQQARRRGIAGRQQQLGTT